MHAIFDARKLNAVGVRSEKKDEREKKINILKIPKCESFEDSGENGRIFDLAWRS